MEYRITVIMGIYNCADTLIEALESLESQTFKNFKVVLCDDGSKDNTFEIAKKWAEEHPNYLVIKNESNLKLAATLNRCLDFADTEYIARMDGDDISLPTRFQKEIDFLDNHPEYALVSCPMIFFDENGDYKTGKAIEKPTKEDFIYGTPFCHAPVLMRREALEAVGRYTDEAFTIRREDYFLWYKFYKAGYKGYNLSEPLYKMFNGRAAFARRTMKHRIEGFKTGVMVLKGLGIKHPYWHCLPGLLKMFVPSWLAHQITKRKR